MRIGIGKTVLAVLVFGLAVVGQAPSPTTVDGGKIIQFLSTTISWYRQRASEQKLATEPADLTYLQENARLADQIVQQAFEFARSEAQRQTQHRAAQQTAQQAAQPQPDNSQYQHLNQALQNVEQQIQQTQTELQSNRDKLAGAPASKRRSLQAQVDELQSELGLLNARHDALQTMTEFVASSGKGKQIGLRAQIDELARSVPPALSGA